MTGRRRLVLAMLVCLVLAACTARVAGNASGDRRDGIYAGVSGGGAGR